MSTEIAEIAAVAAIHWLDTHSVIDAKDDPSAEGGVGGDGLTAGQRARRKMLETTAPVRVEFERLPRGLRHTDMAGRTVIDARYVDEPIDALTATLSDAPTLNGLIEPLDGSYLPRRFSVELALGRRHFIALHRSPAATPVGAEGALVGGVAFEDGVPAAWALLELEVKLGNNRRLYLRAQADRRGEFVLRLIGLPPLPAATTEFQCTLSARAARIDGVKKTPNPLDPPDPTALPAVELGDPEGSGAFHDLLTLGVAPGAVHHLKTKDKKQLLLRP